MLTASDITDAMVDEILNVEDDDIELIDLCETTQKMIVQPDIKRAALERIAEILNARAAKSCHECVRTHEGACGARVPSEVSK